jgi:hypothetical protein
MSVSNTATSNNRLTNDELEEKVSESSCGLFMVSYLQVQGKRENQDKTARLVRVPVEI